MRSERWAAFVAAVALAAGCGSGSTTLGSSSVPPGAIDGGVAGGGGDGGGSGGTTDGGGTGGAMSGGGDGGTMPDGGGGGGTGGGPTPCPTTATAIADGVRVGDADARYVYGFSGRRIVRVPAAGGPAEVVVDGIDTTIDSQLSVDDSYVYWVVRSNGSTTIFRAAKAGGAPEAVGPAAGGTYIIGDPVFYVDGNSLFWYTPGDPPPYASVTGGGPVFPSAYGSRAVWLIQRYDGDWALYTYPMRQPATAHPLDSAAADDEYLFVAFYGDVRRYPIANVTDPSYTTINVATGNPMNGTATLRLYGGYVYFASDYFLRRMTRDGTDVRVVGNTSTPDNWAVAGDSVYYNFETRVYRACR